MAEAQAKKRQIWIDAVRGFAIFVVLFDHLTWNYSNLLFGERPVWMVTVDKYVAPTVGIVAFFFLSGFLYKDGKYPVGAYIKNIAKRTLIPYAVYGVIYAFLDNLQFRQRAINWAGVKQILLGLLWGRTQLYPQDSEKSFTIFWGNSQILWFLACMFFGATIFRLCMEIKGKVRVVVFVVLCAISMALYKLPILLPWQIDTAFLTAAVMMVGHKFADINWREWSKKKTIIAILVALIAFVAIVNIFNIDGANTNFGGRYYETMGFYGSFVQLIVGVVGSAILSWTFYLLEETVLVKVLKHFGQNTMVIFPTHFFLYGKFYGLCSHYGFTPKWLWIVMMAFALLAAEVLRFIYKKLNFKYLM